MFAILSLFLLGLGVAAAERCAFPDPAAGGACHFTTHALHSTLTNAEIDWPDPEIKEWHFHVYFFQQNEDSVNAAMRIRSMLIDAVARNEFIVVLNGINNTILPRVNVSNIPRVNLGPVGPHPCGSYEVWTPKEYLAPALSFMMRHRGELTILLHPLSPSSLEDHTGRAMWLGPPYRLDLTVLEGHDNPQYTELRLGYSAPQ